MSEIIRPFGDGDPYNIWFTVVLTFGIQFTMFLIAASCKFDKVTDIAYGGNFFLLALLQLIFFGTYTTRQLVVLGGIMLWAIRLSIYVMYRILKIGEDKRFDDRRGHWTTLVGFWSLQFFIISVLFWPYNYVAADPVDTPLNTLEIIAAVLFALALLIETVADIQKFRFRSNPANKGHWCDVGLWKYSRHPNFAGEVSVWWTLWIITTASYPNGAAWISTLGPFLFSMTIIGASGIPLLEESADKRYWNREDYQTYKRITPPFWLFPTSIYPKLPKAIRWLFCLEWDYFVNPQPAEGEAAAAAAPVAASEAPAGTDASA